MELGKRKEKKHSMWERKKSITKRGNAEESR